MKAAVTGGAGFIGSHLAERLVNDGHTVTVIDNFETGSRAWIPEQCTIIEGDLRAESTLAQTLDSSYDIVFHFAARTAVDDDRPREQFRVNTDMTYAVVEAVLEAGISELAFASSSTVYGEAPRPTPEDHAPLEPISPYGASKLACEGILSAAAHSHGLTVYNYRFANVVGPRLRGAVIPDFIQKLQRDPDELTILGNGRQQKSYMYIDDCIDAMLYIREHETGPVGTYNLGTRTTTSVNRIADIVSDELGLEPAYEYTGGDRGWTGDVPKMRLSVEKLASLGWTPQYESDAAVRRAARDLV